MARAQVPKYDEVQELLARRGARSDGGLSRPGSRDRDHVRSGFAPLRRAGPGHVLVDRSRVQRCWPSRRRGAASEPHRAVITGDLLDVASRTRRSTPSRRPSPSIISIRPQRVGSSSSQAEPRGRRTRGGCFVMADVVSNLTMDASAVSDSSIRVGRRPGPRRRDTSAQSVLVVPGLRRRALDPASSHLGRHDLTIVAAGLSGAGVRTDASTRRHLGSRVAPIILVMLSSVP